MLKAVVSNKLQYKGSGQRTWDEKRLYKPHSSNKEGLNSDFHTLGTYHEEQIKQCNQSFNPRHGVKVTQISRKASKQLERPPSAYGGSKGNKCQEYLLGKEKRGHIHSTPKKLWSGCYLDLNSRNHPRASHMLAHLPQKHFFS